MLNAVAIPQAAEAQDPALGEATRLGHLQRSLAEAEQAEAQIEGAIQAAIRRHVPAREMRELFTRRAAAIEVTSDLRRRIAWQQQRLAAANDDGRHMRIVLQSPLMKQVYLYWASKKGGREMPARKDLDPVEMRPFLSSLFMVDVEPEPLRYRYRLLGTEVVAGTGRDLTGRYVDAVTFGENFDIVARAYGLVVQQKAPLGRSGHAHWIVGREWMSAEFLLLPLGAEDTVQMILGCFSALPAGLRRNEQRIDDSRLEAGLNPLFA